MAETKKRGRGRPAGVKNKKKKAPTATGVVSTDHNEKDNVVDLRPKTTPAQDRANFFDYRGRYERALASKKETDADLRNLAKSIRADGYSVEAIKLSLLDEQKIAARVRGDVQMFKQVTSWLALPVGAQLSFLDEPDREHSDDKAFKAGEVAGLEGKDCNPPYAPNLPQANQWRQGHAKGQEALRNRFVTSDEKNELPAAKTRKNSNGTTIDDAGEDTEDFTEQAPPTQPRAGGFIGEEDGPEAA